MKKVISLILALLTVFSLCAALTSCGSDENVLIVAMSPDFAPMEFTDTSKTGNDALVGFDVLLSNYIAKELGMKLIIKPMDFYACMSAVQAGSADLAISGFSWTADRAETFLITDYYVAGENETEQVVISLKNNTYSSAADFNGKKVAAQGGSLQELLVKEQLVPAGAELVKFDNTNDALTALKGGQVDAFAVAKGNGEAFISQNEGVVDFSGFEFVVEEKYKNNVVLVNKNNQELCDKVNTVLAKAMAADLYDSWYEACETYAGISTIDEFGYTEDGQKILGWDENDNPITDGSLEIGTATGDDAAKKVAYEKYYNEYKAY